MTPLLDDLRLAARGLAKTPGFTLVVVATLALGIGLTTALFSLTEQVLLWSIPAREPERLVKIEGSYSRTYPFFLAYRELNRSFAGVLASSDNLEASLRPPEAPGVEVGHVEYVSGEYFEVLGLGAAAGRLVAPGDDTAGGPPVAVLTHRYWKRRFSGDPRVVGQEIAVNGHPVVIAGVAERGAGGLFRGDEPDLFLPLALYPRTQPAAARDWLLPRTPWLTCVARLRPDSSFQQARAAMPGLWQQALERVGDRTVQAVAQARLLPRDEAQLSPAARAPLFARNQDFQNPLRALAGVTVVVLLLTCANAATLLLVRAAQRTRQTAVRLALGATRGRLVRQALAESLLLAGGGGALGWAAADFGIQALASLDLLPAELRLRPSLFVLAGSVGITLLTTLLCGLLPALRATRLKLAETMHAHGTAGQTLAQSRLSRLLIANQIALSLALLAGASLFGRTLRNLQNVDLGFQRENVAIVEIDPAGAGYHGQNLRVFYDQFLTRARALPGVRSAALAGLTPISNRLDSLSIAVEGPGGALQSRLDAVYNPVSAGYFTTLGVTLLGGRDFRPEDEPAEVPASWGGKQLRARVCIMDQALARRHFGTVHAVGRRFCPGGDGCPAGEGAEVIGIVKEVHYSAVVRADPMGTFYEPSWASGASARALAVRFAGSPAALSTGLRQALQSQDPNVALRRIRLLEEYIQSHLAQERLIAYLSSLFGLLALGLAALGLYGVLACLVAQRRREIGIRLALGARPLGIVRVIASFLTAPLLAGLAAGTLGGFAWGLFAGSLIYGVEAFDGVAVSQAAAVLAAACVVAAALPARRALQVDPMATLRHE